MNLMKMIQRFSSLKFSSLISDSGNAISFFNEYNEPKYTVYQKLCTLSFYNIYQNLDILSRDILIYCCQDLHLGMGTSIILISSIIKLCFLPTTIMSQNNLLKMKQINPQIQAIKKRIKNFSQSGNRDAQIQAYKKQKQLFKKNGIKQWINLVNAMQIPIMITWFLSLRYVFTLPQIFKQAQLPFLHLNSLAQPDPFMILPILFAGLNTANMTLCPPMFSSFSPLIFKKFFVYFRYVPLASIPFMSFFPSGILLYWCVSSFFQFLIYLFMRTKFFKKNFFREETKVVKPVIYSVLVDQKNMNELKNINLTQNQKLVFKNQKNLDKYKQIKKKQ